jgi:hypothetical protein
VTTAVPAVAVEDVLMVNITAAGLVEVGLTEFEGAKLQVAPAGKFPQERFTVSSKEPCAVTEKETGPETLEGPTVMLEGEGTVKLKSTIFKVKVASFTT